MLQKGCFTPKPQLSFLPFTSLVLTGSYIKLGASCLFRHRCSYPDSHQLSIWALRLTRILFSQGKHPTCSFWMYLLVFSLFFPFLFPFPFPFFLFVTRGFMLLCFFLQRGFCFSSPYNTVTTHNYWVLVYL